MRSVSNNDLNLCRTKNIDFNFLTDYHINCECWCLSYYNFKMAIWQIMRKEKENPDLMWSTLDWFIMFKHISYYFSFKGKKIILHLPMRSVSPFPFCKCNRHWVCSWLYIFRGLVRLRNVRCKLQGKDDHSQSRRFFPIDQGALIKPEQNQTDAVALKMERYSHFVFL